MRWCWFDRGRTQLKHVHHGIGTHRQRLLAITANDGNAPLQPRYAARDLLRGREVTLSDGRHGLCEGVAADGALIVHTAAGREAITSAEVSVRPIPTAC